MAQDEETALIATSLEEFPRLSLGKFPSPLTRATLENGLQFWIKDDGGCSEIYGGNKVRKLEFLLGAVQQRRKNRLIVHGDVESLYMANS